LTSPHQALNSSPKSKSVVFFDTFIKNLKKFFKSTT
jgi:hypothetical protein